jgi:DNA-binding CsgD family transcriptional regulator
VSEVPSLDGSLKPICSRVPLKFSNSAFPATARWIAALASLLVLIDFGARAADDTPPAEAKPPAVKIAIHYLGKQYQEPVPLSLVDSILTDNGLQGARLAIQDNNKSGQFLGQEYDLAEDIVPADGDVAAKAKEILKDGPAFIVADLEANDLLAVADLPEAKASIELQTLALVAEGKPYGVIAEHLHVSYKTVANTCTQLKAKLGVRTLPELMRIAIQHLPSASAKTPRGEWS